MEGHAIAIREILSMIIDFVLCEPLYKVGRERKEDRVQYDVFGSTDMKDVAKVLRKVIKPGALRDLFCSNQQFSF